MDASQRPLVSHSVRGADPRSDVRRPCSVHNPSAAFTISRVSVLWDRLTGNVFVCGVIMASFPFWL